MTKTNPKNSQVGQFCSGKQTPGGEVLDIGRNNGNPNAQSLQKKSMRHLLLLGGLIVRPFFCPKVLRHYLNKFSVAFATVLSQDIKQIRGFDSLGSGFNRSLNRRLTHQH
jgi:hypothetical protein